MSELYAHTLHKLYYDCQSLNDKINCVQKILQLESNEQMALLYDCHPVECFICSDKKDKSAFYVCMHCINSHCADCHKNILKFRQYRCPYCRKKMI